MEWIHKSFFELVTEVQWGFYMVMCRVAKNRYNEYNWIVTILFKHFSDIVPKISQIIICALSFTLCFLHCGVALWNEWIQRPHNVNKWACCSTEPSSWIAHKNKYAATSVVQFTKKWLMSRFFLKNLKHNQWNQILKQMTLMR